MVFIIDSQNAGISGNMFIGALVDMGADSERLKNLMEAVASDFGEVEVSIEKTTKAMIPFYLTMIAGLLLVTFVPEVSLFLPKLLGFAV